MAEEKYMTRDMLSKKVGLTKDRISTYLCRAEFSHIRFGVMGKYRVYLGVTPTDIKRLKALKKCNRSWCHGYRGELGNVVR